MARLFFRLKLRLIRNGLRGRGFRIASFVIGGLFAVQFAFLGFAVLAAPPAAAVQRAGIAIVGFAVLFVGWVIVPVFGYGLDETLDPGRLALLPLTRNQLAVGLFVASATGIAPAATLVALAGVVVGYASFGAGTPIVAAAVVTEFALCLVGARAVTTAMSRILRSRRARDIWIIGFSFFVLAINGLVQSLRFLAAPFANGSSERSAHTVRLLTSVLRWSPPGMAGRAAVEADAGRLGAAVLWLAPAVASVVLLARWWMANLERLTTTTAETSSPRARTAKAAAGRERASSALYPRIGAFLPRNRRGAVAAKDLKYLWREPAQRAQRFTTFLFAIGGVVAVGLFAHDKRPSMTLFSSLFLWWFSLMAMGQFGIDRSAYWMNAVAAGDPEDDLIGKNIAIALLNLPLFVFVAVALAAITGGWAYLPVALATGLGSLGVALGVGNVTSVRLAQPVPESMTNLWAQRTGQGFGKVVVLLTVLVVSQALVAPIAGLVLVGLNVWRPLLAIAVPASLVYGAVLYVLGRRIAAEWLRGHQPELLEALSPRSE